MPQLSGLQYAGCAAPSFCFLFRKIYAEYFLNQPAVIRPGLPVVCKDIKFFLCQVEGICILNNHSAEIWSVAFIYNSVFCTGLCKQLLQSDAINIGKTDQHADIGNAFPAVRYSVYRQSVSVYSCKIF